MLQVRGSHRRCAVWKHQAEHKALNLEWEKLLGSSLVLEMSVLAREHSFIDGAGDRTTTCKRAKVSLDLSFPTKINSKCVKSLRVCKRLKLLGET